MAEVFKSPHEVMGQRNSLGFYTPPPSGSFSTIKKSRGSKSTGFDNKRRRRSREDFLTFCRMILEYENYEQIRSQNMRLRHSSSPMGSTGSSNESWPSSKEEDSEMYSHANDKHAKTSTDEEPDDDMEEPNESWDEVTCYCGKPFAGRPMIECSKCEIWIHLKCAGLRRNNIPDTWHCKKCKTLKQPTTSLKSDNKVSGSRKRKSTKFQQRKKDGEKTVQHQQQPLASTSSAASLAASITSSKETDQS